MACVGCGAANLGTEAAPLVLGEPNGDPAVEVVFISPVVPGSSHGARGWVTGSLVGPYLAADLLDPVPAEPEAPAPAPAPAQRGGTTTKTTDSAGAGSDTGDDQ